MFTLNIEFDNLLYDLDTDPLNPLTSTLVFVKANSRLLYDDH